MKLKRFAVIFLVMTIVLSFATPMSFAEGKMAATRGEVVNMLLVAVDDYNPDVKKTDIIKGYDDGELHEEREVTRAEALVMLKRAFGSLPAPTGHNARVALVADDFTDIPAWAQEELANVFNSGIVAGTAEGIFSPNELVTAEQMELFIKRVFALYGTNPKDDFYAYVNKEALETLEMEPGRSAMGTLHDMEYETNQKLLELLNEIISEDHEKGSREYKIAAVYNGYLDLEERKKVGIEPVKKYLTMLDEANSIKELTDASDIISEELCVYPFFFFFATTDLTDNTKNVVLFQTPDITLPKEFYLEGSDKTEAYLSYVEEMFILGGETKEDAAHMAKLHYEFEKEIAAKSLNIEEFMDVDVVYNIFSFEEIAEMFPQVDMTSVIEHVGFEAVDEFMIEDLESTKAFAEYYSDENLETLKAYAKFYILDKCKKELTPDFDEILQKFEQEYYGIEGSYTKEKLALDNTMKSLSPYFEEIFAEHFFSEQAKKDVERMVSDIVAVYRKRLQNNEWMSDETKEKAVQKLDALGVKVGYPDEWDDTLDSVEILAASDGGSLFSNVLKVAKARKEQNIRKAGEPVDKSEWVIEAYRVNAMYNPSTNDIIFPAAILQAPMYDVNASYEENLGGIGYAIAHEITHAFDAYGAKYGADGNMENWWTENDYRIFEEKCAAMIEFYDGYEGVPGIGMNGSLTLAENVADQGAASCVTEIVAGLDDGDMKTLYESLAKTWVLTAPREFFVHGSQVDTHSTAKVRVNRVVVNFDEFYEAFGITEGDGMYVPPEERVKIW